MIKMAIRFGVILLVVVFGSTKARADSSAWCNDNVQVGWHFYCDPEDEPNEDPKPEPEPIEVSVSPPPSETDLETAQERLARFSNEVEEAKALAILDPTEENLLEYLRIQKEMIDRAENFQKTWSRVLYKSPELDHNTVYPLTNTGVLDYQDRIHAERSAKLFEVSQSNVLMVVTEGPDICYTCDTQLDIIKNLVEQNELSVFVVSKDGYRYDAFPNAEIDEGNLKGMGLDENPTPFFAILNPSTGDIKHIGHGLLTQDQILARVLEVMEPKIIDVPELTLEASNKPQTAQE